MQILLYTMRINKRRMKVFLPFLVMLFSVWGYGQTTIVVRDLETWTGVDLGYKLSDKWKTGFQGQFRLEDNSSEISQYFGQLNLSYIGYKNFEIGGALRYIVNNDNTGNVQGYENHFRFHLDGKYKHKINRFKLKYRIRYQTKNELGVEDEAKKYFRFKAGTIYNIKKWKFDPELSGELFRSTGLEDENQLESYRLTLGTTFKVHKSAKVKLFYRFEKELNTNYPMATNIIGVKYKYNIK